MAALAGATRLARSTPLWQEPVLAGLRLDFLDAQGNIVACGEAYAPNPARNGRIVVECTEVPVLRSGTVANAELVSKDGRFPMPLRMSHPACVNGDIILMQPFVLTA
jgi:hypothetical protein